jgi:hypothetical protein
MDNTWRAKGTVQRNIGFADPRVQVNSQSQVAVSICELTEQGVPFLGLANMSILNVIPHDDGTVDVRWNVAWSDLLRVRLNFIIVN